VPRSGERRNQWTHSGRQGESRAVPVDEIVRLIGLNSGKSAALSPQKCFLPGTAGRVQVELIIPVSWTAVAVGAADDGVGLSDGLIDIDSLRTRTKNLRRSDRENKRRDELPPARMHRHVIRLAFRREIVVARHPHYTEQFAVTRALFPCSGADSVRRRAPSALAPVRPTMRSRRLLCAASWVEAAHRLLGIPRRNHARS